MLQVNCKHCGQAVEVQDLLQAAEQPCPHCGKPLLDDAPAVSVLASKPTGVVGGLVGFSNWLTRDRIAISREDAMKQPPKICICCGAVATRVIQESYQIRFSVSLIQQNFHLLVPYCDKHYRQYVRYLVVAGGLLIFMAVPALLWLFRPDYLKEMGLPIDPGLVTSLCTLIGAVALLVYSSTGVRFVANTPDFIEIRGAAPTFIQAMREQQAHRIDDLP